MPMVFRNDSHRLRLFSQVLDSFSQHRLNQAGLEPGLRCWDVGAGDCGIANYMAVHVAPGEVVASDIDTTHLRPTEPNVTVLAHDVLTNDPPGSFDIIHVRLLASLLPHRWALVEKLTDALKDNGILILEEFTSDRQEYVVRADDPNADALFHEYHDALVLMLQSLGKDTDWDIPEALRRAGLVDFDFEKWTRAWPGGSAGGQLYQSTINQARARLVTHGMAEASIDALLKLVDQPDALFYMHPLASAMARRPC